MWQIMGIIKMRNIKKILFLFILYTTCMSCFADIIQQKHILFDKDRIKLTENYLKFHYGIIQQTILINPRMIVLHFTDTDTLDEAYDLFYPSRLGKKRPELAKYSPLNVSAHF